jgi:hypothetical protein
MRVRDLMTSYPIIADFLGAFVAATAAGAI